MRWVGWTRWHQRIVLAFGGWLALWLVLLVLGYEVEGFALGAAVLALFVLWWFLADTPAGNPAEWSLGQVYDATGRAMPSWSRLELRIAASAEPHLMADEAHRAIRSIVAHRLRAGYGVDLQNEPTAARAIVGDEVYDYVTTEAGPAGRGFVARINQIVERIEKL